MSDKHIKANWGEMVANADLQIAAGTCPLVEDEAIVWANNRINELESRHVRLRDAFASWFKTPPIINDNVILVDPDKYNDLVDEFNNATN